MNYYEHHIGDYIKATAHLSMVEDAAYRRLLDVYYTREGPLPVDRKAVQKLARAQSKDERAAVEYVLEEFFELDANGWHQRRCDEEIAKYLEKAPKAKEKRDNARDRQQRARERRAAMFEELRLHGITPPWDTKTGELETLLLRTKDTSRHAPVTRDNTATQAPVPSPQTPGVHAAATDQREEDPPSRVDVPLAADPITGRAIELASLLRQRGAALQASDPRVRVWAEKGITDAQALTALERAHERREARASPQPINAGLLDSILTDITTLEGNDHGTPHRTTAADRRAAVIAELTGANRTSQGEHDPDARTLPGEARRVR
ncbi:YdaU family protein [Zoogloea dura]|uniref:YdaU family protein n=1 Tax=Zoogloea dura TaxID=2728840 RepID=A0A848FZ06_9RHOO|nr:YdaU family protein [Zoogloea dura]NML24314.1 YdaU family protein [Zoogloea dura]